MKKRTINLMIITAMMVMINVHVVAQNVGIGPNVFTPDNSAGVEMQFTNKGLLIPRVALTSTTDGTTIPSPAHSLIVYNNGIGGLSPEGFYYNAGTTSSPNWVKLSIAKVDGLGTPTQVAFWVDTDSISSSNKLNWNTVDNRLEVTGKVKIDDGSQGVDKILTSDNSGIGTWKSLGTGPTGCASCISMVSNVSTSSMTWGSCADTCRNMTTGGFTDWRMPTFDEVIYYVSGASNISFTASSSSIWTSTPWDVRVTNSIYTGFWVIFIESAGNWSYNNYSNNASCRCVR